MGTLAVIGLVLLGLIVVFGIIRVLTRPFTGFFNCFIEMLFLDWLMDVLIMIIDSIEDITD